MHGRPNLAAAAPAAWAQLSEDLLVSIYGVVAAAAPSPEELAALALVCRHWRAVCVALEPMWRELHWARCRHTDPPLPDLVCAFEGDCVGASGLLTYRRRAVCSRAARLLARPPLFFQATAERTRACSCRPDTQRRVDELRTSLAFRYLVLRYERSMPQTPEENELLSEAGAFDEAMVQSYTAEGEYDSFRRWSCRSSRGRGCCCCGNSTSISRARCGGDSCSCTSEWFLPDAGGTSVRAVRLDARALAAAEQARETLSRSPIASRSRSRIRRGWAGLRHMDRTRDRLLQMGRNMRNHCGCSSSNVLFHFEQ
eukprot:COSAG06_NODE_14170_length_1182_cov_1.674054_1_plen_312_part_00